MRFKMQRVNEKLMWVSNLWQKGALSRVCTQVNWQAGDREFNRVGTLIKCASNLFYFKTSHLVHFAYLALWIIPTPLTLKVLGLSPGNINFLFVFFFLFFFKFQCKLFFKGFAEYVQSKCTCVNVWWLSCYVQIENNVKIKRWDPEKI